MARRGLAARPGFCHNRLAMRAEWRRYWKQVGRHQVYTLFSLLASLFPFLVFLDDWRRRDSVLMGLVYALSFGLTVALVINLMFGAVYALTTLAQIRTGLPVRVARPFQFLVGTVGSVLGIWLALLWQGHFLGGPRVGAAFGPALGVGAFISTLFLLFYAYRNAREDALALRAVAAEARYHALENQMRPHFLFNALNSLAELIESRQDGAAEATHNLAELYRLILRHAGMKTAPLRAEVEIARRYLELEKLRFGARLTYHFHIPDAAAEIYVPSLTLQTLVENAVKHGVAKSVEGGQVTVEVARLPGGLYRLNVVNSGAPYAAAGNGAGLANTRARLDLLYGDRHGFALTTNDASRTVASFCFTGERLE